MECTQKRLKSLAFSFIALTIIFIIAVIVIPIAIKKSVESDLRKKTIPTIFNTDIWAQFPGKIKSKTTHIFKVLDYSSDDSLNIKDTLVLEEKTSYNNFYYNENRDKITFDTGSEFNLDEPKPKNNSIKTINLGMFEAIESFSNPTDYQKGINSILYLFNKVLNSPDLFIRKIFSYDLFNNVLKNETIIRENILNKIEKEKADRILSTEEIFKKYSFKTLYGFYNWIKILNIPEKIDKSSWLYDLFNLTENDINSILGKDTYLNNKYIQFNSDLASRFNCDNKTLCGNEIFYNQLLSGEVLSYFGLSNISSLYQAIKNEYYNFKKSPELFIFFEEFKQNSGNPDIKYDDYAPKIDLFFKLFDSSSKISLLSSKISSLFLMINYSGDIDKAKEINKTLTLNNVKFISDYVYNYLPKLFIYQEYKDKDGTNREIEQFAHAFVTINKDIVDNTYGLLRQMKNIYNKILSQFVWDSLINNFFSSKIKLNKNSNFAEPDELCPLIMQLALDDGRKVLKICSDPVTSFNSTETILKWFEPYYCIIKNETNCDMTIINHLKKIVYITDEEIKSIYHKDYLGGAIEYFNENLTSAFNCKTKSECSDEYLYKLQFWKSGISLNLPFNKSKTISELYPDMFPYPIEIQYFAEKFNYKEEINEEDIDTIIGLYTENKNVLDEENCEAFDNKVKLEQEYTLIKLGKNKTLFNVMHLLNKGYLFDANIKGDYQNIYNILQGNYYDDKKYIEFLSSGKYYEGYKPKLNQTTGFNFGFNLSNGHEFTKKYDKYQISKEEDNLRKITNINNFEILNIQKVEYDYISKKYIYVTSPLYNYESLTSNKKFSDGFQYENSEEEIYLYDKLSSRPLKFIYKEEDKFGDMNCEKFELDKNNLVDNINEKIDSNSNKPFLSQKLNKPFIISVGKDNLNIKDDIETENFICVDPYTNEVVQSKINLVYSIYSKNYGYINSNIENDKMYPVFIYQKVFEVDSNSYLDYFNDITFFKDFRLIFLIVGIVLIVVFVVIALIILIKIHKNLVNEDIQMNSIANDNLINDTRGPTIAIRPDIYK